MKQLIVLLLMMVPFVCQAQTTEDGKYYIYNIVSFEGEFTKEDFKVYYDDGIEVKRMRNDKGEKVRFSTPAGALMYFILIMVTAVLPQVRIGFYASLVQKKNLKKLSKQQRRNNGILNGG